VRAGRVEWAQVQRTLLVRVRRGREPGLIPSLRLRLQYGRAFIGKQVDGELLDWLEGLQCGVDLIDREFYRLPTLSA